MEIRKGIFIFLCTINAHSSIMSETRVQTTSSLITIIYVVKIGLYLQYIPKIIIVEGLQPRPSTSYDATSHVYEVVSNRIV